MLLRVLAGSNTIVRHVIRLPLILVRTSAAAWSRVSIRSDWSCEGEVSAPSAVTERQQHLLIFDYCTRPLSDTAANVCMDRSKASNVFSRLWHHLYVLQRGNLAGKPHPSPSSLIRQALTQGYRPSLSQLLRIRRTAQAVVANHQSMHGPDHHARKRYDRYTRRIRFRSPSPVSVGFFRRKRSVRTCLGRIGESPCSMWCILSLTSKCSFNSRNSTPLSSSVHRQLLVVSQCVIGERLNSIYCPGVIPSRQDQERHQCV